VITRMQSLILAGGKGLRLRPLTIYTPKPIIPVANRPLLLYQIDLLKRAGIRDVTLSLSYQPRKIEDVLADGQDFGVRIRYAVEAQPLGTAGAYKNAQSHLKETTVVFNGDILTDLDLAHAIASHRERGALATIVTATVDDPANWGLVEADAEGRVCRFVEKPRPEEITARTINAGTYILEPRVLDFIPEGEEYTFERHLFPALLAAGEPVYAHSPEAYWMDVGAPQRYLAANLDLLSGKLRGYKVERHAPAAFAGDGEPPRVDKLSVVDPTCTLKAGAEVINSVLGPNCVVEERARIEDSVLLAGTRVGQQTTVRRTVAGKGVIVGKNSAVEGAVLGDKSSLTDYSTA
jgi:mannose-1-phosphate guanylyltransferase